MAIRPLACGLSGKNLNSRSLHSLPVKCEIPGRRVRSGKKLAGLGEGSRGSSNKEVVGQGCTWPPWRSRAWELGSVREKRMWGRIWNQAAWGIVSSLLLEVSKQSLDGYLLGSCREDSGYGRVAR